MWCRPGLGALVDEAATFFAGAEGSVVDLANKTRLDLSSLCQARNETRLRQGVARGGPDKRQQQRYPETAAKRGREELELELGDYDPLLRCAYNPVERREERRVV